MNSNIPSNFIQIPRQSRFSLHLGPMYVPADQTYESKTVRLGLLLEEPHTGGPSRGHGGVTMTLLDEAMGRAASEAVGALCVTISMTTNFCAGTRIGDFITAAATVSRCGKSIVFVDAELRDSNDKLVGSASGTWSNTNIPIPGR
ncbi:MAG: hypothetical protein ACI9PZ_001435 [Parvicella sp.]|jgi:uncharacterized protein (TIGR00369 family)